MNYVKGGRISLIIAVTLPLLSLGSTPAGSEVAVESELARSIQQTLLDRINRDRLRHQLDPVAWDEELAQTATRRCIEQLREGTRGHFATTGVPPYVRYSRAGHYDLVSENVASWSSRTPISTNAAAEMVRLSHNEMLMEIPPHDGHRRAILDPWATHVGIGIAWSGGELRLIEAFSRRYVDLSPAPSFADVHSRPRISGSVIRQAPITAVTAHWEPLPRPLSARRADARRTYEIPPLSMRVTPGKPTPERGDDRTHHDAPALISGSREFDFRASFDRGPGVYTFLFHARPPGSTASISVASVSITAVRSDLDGDPARLGR